MTNLVVNQVPDVTIDVVSDDLININLVEQPSVNVQFDVAQGPSGPKGDEGSVTQEMLSVLSQATAQASLAQGYASAASSVVQQDLSGVNSAALHRSPNAVTAMFVYDTSKDSDGGAWTEKCQHTSWYNEAINGKWLGAQPSEVYARNEGATLGSELVTNGDFSSGTTGWNLGVGSGALSTVGGRLRITSTVNGTTTLIATSALTTVVGKTYKVVLGYGYKTVYNAFNVNVSNALNGTSAYSTNSFGGVGAGSIGTSVVVFTATATTTYVVLRADSSASNVIGDYVEFDNISVKEVTAQTTQTGDYFQLTTDGKFYRLNATSGTTEVFRGNKRDFPRLSAIVAEASSVTIYDLTEPGRPMWMRFVRGAASSTMNMVGTSTISLNNMAQVNAVLAIGTNDSGVFLIDFSKDRRLRTQIVNTASYNGRIAQRNDGLGQTADLAGGLVNNVVNAVAMTVLPDAPVDPVTGLKVPTIAVGTQGGTSFIRHDGTVVSAANNPSTVAKLLCTADGVWASRNASIGQVYFYSYRSIYSGAISSPPGYAFGTPIRDGGVYVLAGNRTVAIAGTAPTLSKELTIIRVPNDLNIKRTQATIANTFNTGHMVGDIRRTYLADVDAGSVTGPELVTNGTFDTDTTGWTSSTVYASTAAVVSGELQVTATAGFGRQLQAITCVVGKTYQISGKARVVSAGNAVLGITTSSIGAAQTTIVGTSSATFVSGSLTFTATTTTYYVVLGELNGSSGVVTAFDNISVKEVVADRSYKTQGASINGTLTKTAVASAAQLVAYSGFSAANYLREPYSADLDFGTGEWTCSAWVNIPTILPVDNFPVVGSELVTNGTFDTDTGWTKGTGWTISDGTAVKSSSASSARINQGTSVTGKIYKVTFTIVSINGYQIWASVGGQDTQTITTTGTYTFLVVGGSQPSLGFGFVAVGATVAVIDNVSFVEVGSVPIIDRSHSTGAKIHLGMNGIGRLEATAFDGTTTRTVTTSAAYNTATWLKAEVDYTTDGTLAISVNGVEVAATRGSPLLTLNNSNAVLTIGNSYALNAPFPGSIALLKFSATVPTAEQSAWMYEQEKQMFRDGAQICLPDSGSIVDLTYDDATDKWIAISATNESEWSGLIRTSVTASPAGSYSKASSTSGIQLLARTTTNPGVDVTIPSYGLREELVRRSESAAKLNARLATFDYVGGFTANTTSGSTAITSTSGLTYPTSYIGARISGSGIPANTFVVAVSGTTIYISAAATATASSVQISFVDFILPVGYEARVVQSSGQNRTEGSTKDYIRLFDGFKETIRFNTAPGYTAAVQIQAGSSQ